MGRIIRAPKSALAAVAALLLSLFPALASAEICTVNQFDPGTSDINFSVFFTNPYPAVADPNFHLTHYTPIGTDPTASGRIYNPYSYTAAVSTMEKDPETGKSFPGTGKFVPGDILEISYHGRSVVVLAIDKGNMEGDGIDLSVIAAAAIELGVPHGTLDVGEARDAYARRIGHFPIGYDSSDMVIPGMTTQGDMLIYLGIPVDTVKGSKLSGYDVGIERKRILAAATNAIIKDFFIKKAIGEMSEARFESMLQVYERFIPTDLPGIAARLRSKQKYTPQEIGLPY